MSVKSQLENIVQTSNIKFEQNCASMFLSILEQYNNGQLTTNGQLYDIFQTNVKNKWGIKQTENSSENSAFLLDLYFKVKPSLQVTLADSISNLQA